jgi:hypothetical protein
MPTQIVTYGVEKLTLPRGVYYRPFVVKRRDENWQIAYDIMFVTIGGHLTRSFALNRTAIKTKKRAEARLAEALAHYPEDRPQRTRMRYIVQINRGYYHMFSVWFARPVTHVVEPNDNRGVRIMPSAPGEGHRTARYGSIKYAKSTREATAWIRRTSPDAGVTIQGDGN